MYIKCVNMRIKRIVLVLKEIRKMMPLYFSITSTLDTQTLGSLWKKNLITNYLFLDVLVDNNDPISFLTRVYRKKTFTGLLTNYFSFTSYSYKVGLIRTLIDRAYKINNTWLGLHEDITKLMEILKKNLFPAHLIERVVNRYITGTISNHCPQGSLPTSPIFYFNLPYIGHFSVVNQKKIRYFIKRYCNDLDIKLVFSSFKIGNLLGVKDPISGVHVWFISLYVQAVMPVMLAKQPGIFPHTCVST